MILGQSLLGEKFVWVVGGVEGNFSVTLWSKTLFKALDLDLDQAEQYKMSDHFFPTPSSFLSGLCFVIKLTDMTALQ